MDNEDENALIEWAVRKDILLTILHEDAPLGLTFLIGELCQASEEGVKELLDDTRAKIFRVVLPTLAAFLSLETQVLLDQIPLGLKYSRVKSLQNSGKLNSEIFQLVDQ